MVRITAGGREFEYERIGKNRSEDVFEVVMLVESRGGEMSFRTVELNVSSRDDLTGDRLASAIEEWQQTHPTLTIERFVVRETKRCGFGELFEPARDAGDQQQVPLYRGGGTQTRSRARNPYEVGFGDVPVDQGEEVEFHVAGPDTSVYGTDTGTVTGVKTGTDEYDVVIVETDSGTKRVREDWLVGHDEDDGARADAGETDAAEDEN
ncbi:MAG: hypothetical protein V5A44_09445 [Haloarculaceae archaeon]